MQKIDVLLYGFCCFTSTNPQGRVFGGAIYRRGFCVTSWGGGLIFEGAYFPNFTVYGSNQSTYKCSIIFEDAYYIHECILH